MVQVLLAYMLTWTAMLEALMDETSNSVGTIPENIHCNIPVY
jgi:hypothetical protein